MTIWREMLLSDDWCYDYYLLFIAKFILLMTCWINIVISFEYEKNKSYSKVNCISNSFKWKCLLILAKVLLRFIYINIYLWKIFNAIIAAIYSFIATLDVRCMKSIRLFSIQIICNVDIVHQVLKCYLVYDPLMWL